MDEHQLAAVIVFDGVCILCNRWVDFILKHDRKGRYHLATMQGQHGRALLIKHGLSADSPSSLLLVEDGHGYTDTEAIARVLRTFGRGSAVLSAALRWIPRCCSDPLYRWVARYRYGLFGRLDQCRVPDPTQAWRFLD